jgi:hypothetical protein
MARGLLAALGVIEENIVHPPTLSPPDPLELLQSITNAVHPGLFRQLFAHSGADAAIWGGNASDPSPFCFPQSSEKLSIGFPVDGVETGFPADAVEIGAPLIWVRPEQLRATHSVFVEFAA